MVTTDNINDLKIIYKINYILILNIKIFIYLIIVYVDSLRFFNYMFFNIFTLHL